MEILATKVVRQISEKKFLFYSSKNLFVTYIHSSLLLFDDECKGWTSITHPNLLINHINSEVILLERICRFDFSKVPFLL